MNITRRFTSPRPLVTDPANPGAALVLSVDALTAWLNETLGEPCAVAIRRVRYDAGVTVAVAFDLSTVRDGRRVTRPCVARAFGRPTRADLARLLRTLPASHCLAVDPTRGVLVTGAGGDRELPLLPHVFGDEGVAPALDRALPGVAYAGTPTVRTLRHDPGRRWVGVLEHGDGAPLLLRAYRNRDELERATGGYDAFRTASVRVPRVLGTSRSLAFAVVGWADGPGLDGSSRIEDWQAAGTALAQLHTCSGSPLTTTGPDAETATLERTAQRLATLLPESAPQVRALADIVARLLERTPRDHVPLHGACTPDRIILGRDGRPTLTDLESARFGASAADVGCVVAATLVAAEDAGMAPRARGEIDALLAGYQAVRRTPDPFAVGLHTVASRLRTALDPFAAGAPDWRARASRRLEAAQAALDDVALVGGRR